MSHLLPTAIGYVTALRELKDKSYDDEDIPNLTTLQLHLKESLKWVNDILNRKKDASEDEIDASLTISTDTEKDEHTTPPTVTPPLTLTSATGRSTRTTAHANSSTMQHGTGSKWHTTTRHQKPHRQAKGQRQQQEPSRQPSTRLLVHIPGRKIPLTARPHPATFRDQLNKAVGMRAIESTSYSRAGQLVLHSSNPYTAEQLASQSDQLWPSIQTVLGIKDTALQPVFEPDDAWARIVIHQVPLPVWDGTKSARATKEAITHEFCETNSIPVTAVRRMHWLCSKEITETRVQSLTTNSPAFISIMIALSGPDMATPLRKKGVVMLGAHCKVTDYKERNKPRNPAAVDHTPEHPI